MWKPLKIEIWLSKASTKSESFIFHPRFFLHHVSCVILVKGRITWCREGVFLKLISLNFCFLFLNGSTFLEVWQFWDQRFQVLPSLSQVDIKIPLWTKEFKNLSCSKPFSKKNFNEMNFPWRALTKLRKLVKHFLKCSVYLFYKNQNSF